jgi:hypothetical protein
MTPRPLIALLGVLLLGLHHLTAEVPVDEPVAFIDAGNHGAWIGATGNAVHLRGGNPTGVWTFPYTPEGTVGAPVSSPAADGYHPLLAGDDKVLLDKDRSLWTSSAFRVMRLTDGAILNQINAPFHHIGGSPRPAPGGWFALGNYGSPASLHFLSYLRGADSPTIRPITTAPGLPAPSLLAVSSEWIALWGTETQVGNKIITLYRLADLAEIHRFTIPWQEGFEGVASAHGGLLYYRTKNDYRCLDVTSGAIAPVFTIEPDSFYRSYQSILADAGGLWFHSPVEPELRHYRGNPAQGFQLDFRGKFPGQNSEIDADLHLSQGRIHVASSSRTWVFDPLASRPRLLPPGLPPVREMDAVIPIPLSLDRPAERELSVRFRTAGGSATPGLDYEPIDRTVVFPAGSRKVEVSLRILQDLVAESFETIVFETTDPDGIRLPTAGPGGLSLVSSGLESREIALKGPAGAGLTGASPKLLLEEVILGTVSGDIHLHLWDRRTGAYRGPTEIRPEDYNSSPRVFTEVIETGSFLEATVQTYQTMEILRVDAATGQTLAKRSFTMPSWTLERLPIGGGRVFSTSRIGNDSTLYGRVYALDGPAEGVDFPLFGGLEPGNFTALSDGKRLIFLWRLPSSDTAPGPRQRLRCYDTTTMDIEYELVLNDLPSPFAIRGDLLLCQAGYPDKVIALDLPTGTIRWQQENVTGTLVTGNTHMISDAGIWEIATGLKVSSGTPFDSRLPDRLPSLYAFNEIAGPGGILIGNHDLRADRQRPGLEWLGTQLRPDEEQARIPLRSCEPSNQTLAVGFKRIDAANPNDRRELSFPTTPATVPGDGKIHLHDFHAPPTGLESLLYPTTHSIEVRVASPGAVPLVRFLTMRREESTAPLPETLVNKLPAIAALNMPRFQMRFSDGRIVLATGTDYPEVDPDGKIHILDAATGNLLFSMSDPTPMYRRAFAMDATVMGNKLLVLVRHVPTGVRTAEIYDIPSRALLGTIVDPASGKTNPSYLDVSTTHFSLGAASISPWDKKSIVAVFQWSDFRRVLQKTGRTGGGLGNGVDLKNNLLFAGIDGGKADDTGLLAQPVGTKAKIPKPPKGMGGQVIPGDPLLYLMDNNGFTRAYDPATYREVWSIPERITGATHGTERTFAWTQRNRDLSVADALTGKALATSRVSGEGDRPYSLFTAVVASPDRLYLNYRNRLISIAPADLGDFADTRRWKNLPPVLASPNEDLDSNGQADFAEYVVRRLLSGGTLGSVRIQGGQVIVGEGATPPVDLVSLAEVEVASGWWYPVAWRDGISPWVTRPLPAGTSDATPLRVRHLPHPTLGWFPPLLSWPPLAVAIAGDDTNALPAPAANLAARSLASSAGDVTTGPESQPLRLVRSGSGWAVEYLRALDEAHPGLLESSTDLVTWTPVADEPPFTISTAPAGPGMEKVVLTVEASDTRRFFRLRR